jgi:hypothetical protein
LGKTKIRIDERIEFSNSLKKGQDFNRQRGQSMTKRTELGKWGWNSSTGYLKPSNEK